MPPAYHGSKATPTHAVIAHARGTSAGCIADIQPLTVPKKKRCTHMPHLARQHIGNKKPKGPLGGNARQYQHDVQPKLQAALLLLDPQ